MLKNLTLAFQERERQVFVLERMLQQRQVAIAEAAKRLALDARARHFYVNNETGDDLASGLNSKDAVRTLGIGVSLLKPGDTLHLEVTSQP